MCYMYIYEEKELLKVNREMAISLHSRVRGRESHNLCINRPHVHKSVCLVHILPCVQMNEHSEVGVASKLANCCSQS